MKFELFFDTRPEWIEAVRAWAETAPRITTIWVIGSRATGRRTPKEDPDPVPDLDLGFLLSTKPFEAPQEPDIYVMCMRQRWTEYLGTSIPVKVDLCHAEPENDERVWPAIQQHGVLIYQQRGP